MEKTFVPERAESLGLITTYRCTFRCAHCLYCASPGIEEHGCPGALADLIRQIDTVLDRPFLHIGGGEPLLFPDRAREAISMVRKTRIRLEYLETNGSLLLQDPAPTLQTLKEAGLNRLLLSISPFHNEFIALRDLKRLLPEIVRVFGSQGLFLWHHGYVPFIEAVSEVRPTPLDEYFSRFTQAQIVAQLTSIMYLHPGGRSAYLLARYLPGYPPEVLCSQPCRTYLSSPVHAHLDYRGNYLTGFCSGLRLGKEKGRELGRLFSEGIDLRDYPVLDILINEGVGGLYAKACSKGYESRRGGYVSPCHLCLDLRVFLYFREQAYEELYPAFLYDELRALSAMP